MANFWEKLSGSFRKKAATGAQVTPTGYEAYSVPFGETDKMSKAKELLHEMRSWTYACVNVIADEIGASELKLYQQGPNGSVKEIVKHDILDTLYKVNNFTTKFDHFWLTTAYLELTGESPWFLEKDKTGKIQSIFFLRPDRIEPIPDKQKVIKGYKYFLENGQIIELDASEVLFLKRPDPANPFRGLGTLQAAARTVDIDNFAEEWNRTFYINSARPDSVLKVKANSLTKEQKEKLKASINQSYRGVKNSHELMILFGDMELDKFGFNMKDMDFAQQMNFGRDKILGLFRVPKAILAQTEGTNFASAKVAQYVFARWTIQPKLEQLVQQLNEFFVPMFPNSETLFLDYDNPIPADDDSKTAMYTAAAGKWMTVNEIRAEEGLPDIVGGDSLYVPLNSVPIGTEDGASREAAETTLTDRENDTQGTNTPPDQSNPSGTGNTAPAESGSPTTPAPASTPAQQEQAKILKGMTKPNERFRQLHARSKDILDFQDTKENIRQKIKGDIYKQIRKDIKKERREVVTGEKTVNLKSWDDIKKRSFWAKKNEVYVKYAKRVSNKMKDIFQEQFHETLGKLNAQKGVLEIKKAITPSKVLLDPKKVQKRLAIDILPILTDLYIEAGDLTFEEMGLDMNLDATATSVANKLKAEIRDIASSTTDTTNQKLKETLAEGLKNEESIDKLADRVQNVFTEASDVRAQLIGRTESISFNVNATLEAYKQSGVVEASQWVVDGDPCPDCIEMDGRIVGLDENFLDIGDSLPSSGTEITYDNIDGPPLHPNCECDLAPIFINQGEE